MLAVERSVAMCALAAVEMNMAELRGVLGWWDCLSLGSRQQWMEFMGTVRAYQRDLQNRPEPLIEPEKLGGCSEGMSVPA